MSSIFAPKYPKAALGIQAFGISAVALKGNRKELQVRQAASVELPQGLVTPSFTDTNIASPSEFTAYLQEVVELAGLLQQKQWSVTLPSGTARTAIISLDTEPASKQEFEEVFDWKAEQSFGVPAAELRISRERISQDAEKRSRYFTTAITLSAIDEYESQFESQGWRAGLILPRALGEANWLINSANGGDSMLISATAEGFTAMVIRGSEPAVVRSVQCAPNEIDDEIYRLVMFYHDRLGHDNAGLLQRLLVVGKSLVPSAVQKIASEALGTEIRTVRPDELGLVLPDAGLSFDDIAAPAGAAALAF